MSVYSLYIINKSGGLIFSKDFNSKNALSSNDRMRLASTFHSLTAISTQFAPAKNSRGINYVLAETVSIHSYRTITGINFLVISNPTVPYLEGLLDEIYVLFADYVMKNPFYELEMPIRCSLFEEKLDTLIASHSPFCEQTLSP